MNALHAMTSTSSDRSIRERATEAIDTLGTAARDEAAHVAQATRDYVDQAAASARDAAGRVKYEAALVNHKAKRYVQDQPMKSVLIAVAAGAALACIALLASHRR